MQIGNAGWVAGWTGLSILLAIVAALAGPGPAERPTDPIEMIRVSAGTFVMGTEADALDARPAHPVPLQAFEIDKVPVVNADFAAYLNQIGQAETDPAVLYDVNDPSARITRLGGRFLVTSGFEQHPVTAEHWQGARSFCAWRGARLPSEAEWERAARGAEGRRYPWGNEPPDASRARYAFRLFDYVRVGSYPAGATPDGMLDMAGNVWQWTSSLYRPYPYRADDGREDPDASGERVARGGSHTSSAEMLRTTYRGAGMDALSPAARPPITFRCARDAR